MFEMLDSYSCLTLGAAMRLLQLKCYIVFMSVHASEYEFSNFSVIDFSKLFKCQTQ